MLWTLQVSLHINLLILIPLFLLSDLSIVWDTPFSEQGKWVAESSIRNMYDIRENGLEFRLGEIFTYTFEKFDE